MTVVEWMRSVELANWHQMRDDAAEAVTCGPDMQMKSRWLDYETGWFNLAEIERDGVIGRRANRGSNTANFVECFAVGLP
jgi:hypothetical protein